MSSSRPHQLCMSRYIRASGIYGSARVGTALAMSCSLSTVHWVDRPLIKRIRMLNSAFVPIIANGQKTSTCIERNRTDWEVDSCT
jgi:hypothetical protein